MPVGLVQAYVGESVPFTRAATMIFSTIITLWVAGMGLLLLQKEGFQRDASPGVSVGGEVMRSLSTATDEVRWAARSTAPCSTCSLRDTGTGPPS